jgi:AraC-like DNA-binding protein
MYLFLIVTTPVYVTLFWAILLLLRHGRQNRARFGLGIFMILAALLYSCHALFFLKKFNIYLGIDFLYMFSGLSVYPMYYWYVKLLTSETEYNFRNLIHFAPAVVLTIIFEITHLNATPAERNEYFQLALMQNDVSSVGLSGNAGLMAKLFFMSRIVFVVQIIGYLINGFYKAHKYNQRLANFYSNLEHRKLAWVKLISISFLVTSVVSIVFNIMGRSLFVNNHDSLIIPSALFSALLFTIGLQGYKQNQTVNELSLQDAEPDAVNDASANQTKELLKKRFLELLFRDKFYLSPDLRITTLCTKLNTNQTSLSSIINSDFGESFNTFINRHRIEHACRLLRHPNKNHSLDTIARVSGYESTTSFIKAFKTVKGLTPGKWTAIHAH